MWLLYLKLISMIKYEIKIIQSVSHDQETFLDSCVENAYLAVVLDP